jgi:hypothetical protein
MPMMPQREQHNHMDNRERETLNALIREQVIHSLGEPVDLVKVQVRRLWENCYRVNVLTGADAVSAKIANSYFVGVDSDGKVVDSIPKIRKEY